MNERLISLLKLPTQTALALLNKLAAILNVEEYFHGSSVIMKSKTYVCTVQQCSKSFTSHFNLKRHIDSIHLGCNRFVCELCGKTLTSKQNYIQHSYIHTGDKPLVCPEPGCGLHFRQGSLLSMHKKVHNAPPMARVPCNLKVNTTQLSTLLYLSSDPDLNPLLSHYSS